MTDPIPTARPAIKADGRAVREMRKQIVKHNTNKEKRMIGKVHLARHNLAHGGHNKGVSSGAINK